MEAYRLLDNTYQRIAPSSEGRFWSRELRAELGLWHGEYEREKGPWLRLFHSDGRLVPTHDERAEEAEQRADQAAQRAERAKQERQRAEQARQRADAAELENARLRAHLAELGTDD